MDVMEAIKEAAAGEIAAGITFLVAVLAAAIEKSSLEWKPLTRFFGFIGRAINQDVIESNKKLIEKIDKVETDVGELRYDLEQGRAKSARTRVLRFGDELIRDVRHSKEHFDDALRDITEYETYCAAHPEFENDQMVLTVQHVKKTYLKCLEEHSFL